MVPILVLAGAAGLLFGLINVVYPLGRWRVTTRKRGAAVLAASLVVVSLGATSPTADGPIVAATPTTVAELMSTSPTVVTTTTQPGSTTTSTTIDLPDVPRAELIFAAPSSGASGDPEAPTPPGSETMAVAGITDGDTIEVTLTSGSTDTVRLIGVNSPESGECFAVESALVLAAVVPVGSVMGATVDASDRDRYDRLLRYLWVGGMSVNEEVVRRGGAISRRYPPDTALASRFEAAQDEARTDELGLWERDACGPAAGTEVEVMTVEADAPGDDNANLNAEFVRLQNGGPLAVDMTGWVLNDESASHRYTFPDGFVLAAGATVQIHTGCGNDTAASLYWCNNGAVWNNDGDTAFVHDHNGNIAHSQTFVPATTTTATTTTTTTTVPQPTTAPTSEDCHPSYTGACVPFASDVDCLGGSGNGPEYVGRVSVVGPDVYDLDRDNDGVGCE